MIDRRLLRDFDWVMFGLTVALATVGAAGVYSATHGAGSSSPLYFDHLGRLGVGLAALFLATLIDYHVILHYAWIAYGLGLAMLIAVDVIGMIGMGAQRWLSLGGVSIQPSEFFKLALVIVIARYFSGLRKPAPYAWSDVWPIAVATAVPFLLVMKQPDLGTAMILVGIFVIMLFVAGAEVRLFGWTAGAVVSLAAVLFGLFALGIFNPLGFLREYQLRRIRVLLDPSLDPLGAGYHINQSKIAIGSGGLGGKGFLHGTQSGLNFLPEQHTDFIFSVVSEEWGFIGSIVVIVLIILLLLRAVRTAQGARDFAGSLLTMGVATIFFLHCAINIGMTTGIMPVVGLPLPLLSYGGSSVLTTFAGIGLILNVRMRRYLYG
jgi:rod shape determining protein RodA